MTREPSLAVRVFLGGADLEMAEIRALLERAGADVVDADLSWGARASTYEANIRAALEAGLTPVLVELADDLPAEVDRSRIRFVDHHGPLAGADRPSALRQVHDLLAPDLRGPWTRHMALVEANDVGHIRGLRAAGATDEEIRAIRDADRAAQGVTADQETAARRLVCDGLRVHGRLTEVEAEAALSSALGDYLDPVYGGPGVENLLVVRPGGLSFFGDGRVIEALRAVPGCWWGGALPERGYWGANLEGEHIERLRDRIRTLAE